MKKAIVFSALFLMTTALSNAVWADGTRVVVRPFAAVRFAALPPGVNFPEGITANPYNGDIYVSTFNSGGNNQLLRYNKVGHLEEALSFGGTPLLGLAFNKVDQKVYIANLGASEIQRVDANFDSTTVSETVANIPTIAVPPNRMVEPNPDESVDIIMFGSNGFPGPNAMVFDDSGNLFISDSFQGAIFTITTPDLCGESGTLCTVDTLVQDALLATAGFPAFGANGLALGDGESTLYVANTGDDRVLKVDVKSGVVSRFAESINGADGLAVDNAGYLWVAANQADQVVALNRDGKVVAEVGEFFGIRPDGSVRGFLFPASIAIVGRKMFVTNLALPLLGDRDSGSSSEPEADVSKDTISRINIPRL